MDACKECKREPARKGKDLCPGCMTREVAPTRQALEDAIEHYAAAIGNDIDTTKATLDCLLNRLFPPVVTGQASEWDA